MYTLIVGNDKHQGSQRSFLESSESQMMSILIIFN